PWVRAMNGGTISSEIVGTWTSSTEWPSSSSAAAVERAASLQAGSVGMPSGASPISPMRSVPGGVLVSSANGRGGPGALYQASGSGPAIASSATAESAPVRDTTPSTTAPSQLW